MEFGEKQGNKRPQLGPTEYRQKEITRVGGMALNIDIGIVLARKCGCGHRFVHSYGYGYGTQYL